MTDRYVWLFNRILEGIEDRFPGKKIGFYAYDAYKLPPRRVKPDPRIVPAFAPITLCRLHGLDNPVCPDRSFYKSLMRRWGELVPEIFERGYYFNLADPGFPFSKVHALRQETPFAHGAGIRGWRVECMPAWSAHTPTLYVAAQAHVGRRDRRGRAAGRLLRVLLRTRRRAHGRLPRRHRPRLPGHRLPRRQQSLPAPGLRRRLARAVRPPAGRGRGSRGGRHTPSGCASTPSPTSGSRPSSPCWSPATPSTSPPRHGAPATGAGPHRHHARLPPGRGRPSAVAAHRPTPTSTASGAPPWSRPTSAPWSAESWWLHSPRSGTSSSIPPAWARAWAGSGRGRSAATGSRMHTSTATWSEQGLHYYKGAAWYRTEVEVPAAWAGRPIHHLLRQRRRAGAGLGERPAPRRQPEAQLQALRVRGHRGPAAGRGPTAWPCASSTRS